MPGDFHINRIASNKSADLVFLKNHKHLCDAVGGFCKTGGSSPAGSKTLGCSYRVV